MPKKIVLSNHLSSEELLARYRSTTNTIAKSHYQIMWLLSTGKTTQEVASVTGYSRTWIYQLLNRYNQQGVEGLGDLRQNNPGREPLLNDIQQAQLHQVLSGPAPDGGLWNGRKVAEWMSQITGKKVTRMRGWEYLKQMEYSLRVPRPEHREVSVEEQEKWKKKLPLKMQFLQAKYPQAEIELWSEDEHRIGLQPILRRVWTAIGEQPIAEVKPEYKWLWLYGFVHPESGENKAWILPSVNTELFNRVLADFAREFQLNRHKRVLLVLARAGWHITDKLELPEGLDLHFLPPHSPELQPVERLWPLTNEVIANDSPPSLKNLEELLIFRCRKLLQQQDLIGRLTCYHWWPMTRAT